MRRPIRRAVLAATLASFAGCAGATASAGEIPDQFHGTWSFDTEACAHVNEVKMVIYASGYVREEIDATVREVRRENPARLRIAFDSRAEGMAWSGSEQWSISASRNELVIRSARSGEVPAQTTNYVRCR